MSRRAHAEHMRRVEECQRWVRTQAWYVRPATAEDYPAYVAEPAQEPALAAPPAPEPARGRGRRRRPSQQLLLDLEL